MAIIVDKDGNVVTVENQTEEPRELFPNVQEGGGVQDVLIDNISRVGENGIAIIPIAGPDRFGVIKVSGYGLQMQSNGYISTKAATAAEIKSGTRSWEHIAPSVQHLAAFYGLAKAAGDTTQAASDKVIGDYTDDAKTAIQKMLGVYDAPFRLLKEISGGSVSGNIYIDRDLDNNALSLKEVVIIFDGVQASGTGTAGIAINGDSQTITGGNVPFLAIYNLYHTSARNMAARLCINGGLFFGDYMVHAADDMAGTSIGSSINAYGKFEASAIRSICIGSVNNYNFTRGTIKVMGR